MNATKLTSAAAALAAGTLLLTGCDANTAGSSGASSGGMSCDPNGWGPLSGCDTADSPSHEPARVDRVTGSRPEFEQEVQSWDQRISEADGGGTVTVTWIVVKIDVTGFRECVLSLQEAPPNSDDHFNRRITTLEDCEAQQVDTVYRPVGE